MCCCLSFPFFFSSRRRHTRYWRDWSSDVCSFYPSRRRHTRYWRDWSSDVCSSDLPVMQHINLVQLLWCKSEPQGHPALRVVLEEVRGEAAAFQIGRASCRERV